METALIYTGTIFESPFAKTAHSLLRYSGNYQIQGVVDHQYVGKDISNTPFFASIHDAIQQMETAPQWCIVGVALPGGIMPPEFLQELITAMQHGMSIVSGLHQFLTDQPKLVDAANKYDVKLIDVRKSKPANQLRFWTGDVYQLKMPIVAVLGCDCAVGKQTTAMLLQQACTQTGIKAEMIYTGQTAQLQGYPYGFILDATPNDFVCGELEGAILQCATETNPDVIFLEGQSGLRNPSGPCGAELLLSGAAKKVILQYTPGREYYIDAANIHAKIPPLEDEIALISMYGAAVIGVSLNEDGISDDSLQQFQKTYQAKLNIPVVRPLTEGVEPLVALFNS